MFVKFVLTKDGKKVNFAKLSRDAQYLIISNKELEFSKLIENLNPESFKNVEEGARKKAMRNLPKNNLAETFRLLLFPRQ